MKVKFLITAILLFSCFFLMPQILGGVNAETCEDNSPTSKPILISAVSQRNSVTLTWTKAQDPVTHYLLAYGKSETNMEYGNQNIGGREATTYTVEKLDNGVKYYFKVRPVNGCRPGDFSNKLSSTPGVSKTNNKVVTKSPNLSLYKAPVLGTNTSIEPTSEPTKTEHPTAAPVIINNKTAKCSSCISWALLVTEIIVLILFLTLAKRISFLKYIFSILIPVIIYLLFLKFNQDCSPRIFSCKYFLPLDVIIFMAILIAHKNKLKVSTLKTLIGMKTVNTDREEKEK